MPTNIGPSFSRSEIVAAIADMAIAARSGNLLRAYQREWAWQDQHNFQDAVDANDFNEAFHGIESEFDKLALLLTQGSNAFPAPDWDSGDISFDAERGYVLLRHGLNSSDLLVDVKLSLPLSDKQAIAAMLLEEDGVSFDPTPEWLLGNLSPFFYLLPDPDHIMVFASTRLMPQFFATNRAAAGIGLEQAELQIHIWKY